MNVEISKNLLAGALSALGKLVCRTSPVEVYRSLRIEGKENNISFQTVGLDEAITCTLPVEGAEEFQVVVNFDDFRTVTKYSRNKSVVTDFGRGNFPKEGLLLFTIRNGLAGSSVYTKPYAEKIMISRSEQVTLMHCHVSKTEDIINRGGGRLIFELYNRRGDAVELDYTPVTVSRDGERITVPAGTKLFLEPGQSLTLTPNLFHKFYGELGGDVMVGEVSAVNDDHNDNIFLEPQLRFPVIEEDEPPYRLLVSDLSQLRAGDRV